MTNEQRFRAYVAKRCEYALALAAERHTLVAGQPPRMVSVEACRAVTEFILSFKRDPAFNVSSKKGKQP